MMKSFLENVFQLAAKQRADLVEFQIGAQIPRVLFYEKGELLTPYPDPIDLGFPEGGSYAELVQALHLFVAESPCRPAGGGCVHLSLSSQPYEIYSTCRVAVTRHPLPHK